MHFYFSPSTYIRQLVLCYQFSSNWVRNALAVSVFSIPEKKKDAICPTFVGLVSQGVFCLLSLLIECVDAKAFCRPRSANAKSTRWRFLVSSFGVMWWFTITPFASPLSLCCVYTPYIFLFYNTFPYYVFPIGPATTCDLLLTSCCCLLLNLKKGKVTFS